MCQQVTLNRYCNVCTIYCNQNRKVLVSSFLLVCLMVYLRHASSSLSLARPVSSSTLGPCGTQVSLPDPLDFYLWTSESTHIIPSNLTILTLSYIFHLLHREWLCPPQWIANRQADVFGILHLAKAYARKLHPNTWGWQFWSHSKQVLDPRDPPAGRTLLAIM